MVKGGSDMWAQLMSFRVKPGKDTARLREQLQAVEQPGSGLLRTMIMQDQKDRDQFYTVVVFESEEKARARERDPRRQEGLQALRAMLADRLAGEVRRSSPIWPSWRNGPDKGRAVQQRTATYARFGCSGQASTYAPCCAI